MCFINSEELSCNHLSCVAAKIPLTSISQIFHVSERMTCCIAAKVILSCCVWPSFFPVYWLTEWSQELKDRLIHWLKSMNILMSLRCFVPMKKSCAWYLGMITQYVHWKSKEQIVFLSSCSKLYRLKAKNYLEVYEWYFDVGNIIESQLKISVCSLWLSLSRIFCDFSAITSKGSSIS